MYNLELNTQCLESCELNTRYPRINDAQLIYYQHMCFDDVNLTVKTYYGPDTPALAVPEGELSEHEQELQFPDFIVLTSTRDYDATFPSAASVPGDRASCTVVQQSLAHAVKRKATAIEEEGSRHASTGLTYSNAGQKLECSDGQCIDQHDQKLTDSSLSSSTDPDNSIPEPSSPNTWGQHARRQLVANCGEAGGFYVQYPYYDLSGVLLVQHVTCPLLIAVTGTPHEFA